MSASRKPSLKARSPTVYLKARKGWIDLLAGARYMYMGSSLRMTLDNSGVTSVTEDLSSRVIDRAVQTARDEVNKRLPELIGQTWAPLCRGARPGPRRGSRR